MTCGTVHEWATRGSSKGRKGGRDGHAQRRNPRVACQLRLQPNSQMLPPSLCHSISATSAPHPTCSSTLQGVTSACPRQSCQRPKRRQPQAGHGLQQLTHLAVFQAPVRLSCLHPPVQRAIHHAAIPLQAHRKPLPGHAHLHPSSAEAAWAVRAALYTWQDDGRRRSSSSSHASGSVLKRSAQPEPNAG